MGLFDLFKPAWQSNNKEKALKAVEKMTDQNKLLNIAIEANRSGDFDIALIASKKITNPELAKELTKELMTNIR